MRKPFMLQVEASYTTVKLPPRLVGGDRETNPDRELCSFNFWYWKFVVARLAEYSWVKNTFAFVSPSCNAQKHNILGH